MTYCPLIRRMRLYIKFLFVRLRFRYPFFSPVPHGYKPWESLWGCSATSSLVDFHHRQTACPSYKKAVSIDGSFFLWLGYLDSNQGNARFRVWCLTAWLYPNASCGTIYILQKNKVFVNSFPKKLFPFLCSDPRSCFFPLFSAFPSRSSLIRGHRRQIDQKRTLP